MKLTKSKLKQLIKEVTENVLDESHPYGIHPLVELISKLAETAPYGGYDALVAEFKPYLTIEAKQVLGIEH